jgi:glycerol-3-phosphate dehydrogenase
MTSPSSEVAPPAWGGADAAARGLSVVLVESHDFAKGTSSRATKLVHGGVRYLAQGNIGFWYARHCTSEPRCCAMHRIWHSHWPL